MNNIIIFAFGNSGNNLTSRACKKCLGLLVDLESFQKANTEPFGGSEITKDCPESGGGRRRMNETKAL